MSYQKGHPQYNTGRTHFKKGHIPWSKGTNGLMKPNSGSFKKGEPSPLKGKKNPKGSIAKMGKENPMYRKTPWNKGLLSDPKRKNRLKEMGTWQYIEWRKSVFERDNFICQMCKTRGGELIADHIKMWALYPELRYDINNGQTLCKECSKEKTKKELSIYWKNQYKEGIIYANLPSN